MTGRKGLQKSGSDGGGSNTRMDKVISECRASVRPTERQAAKAKRTADMLLGLVEAGSARHPEITGVELGGSYKKGTWLARPEMDIDVYVRFDPKTSGERFKRIAINVGLEALKDYEPYMKFSDHPYVEARLDRNTLANVVPCYDVTEPTGEWRSAADRSRFHTDYMTRKLTEEMRDDVRLLKAFLKANGLYGAQIERGGFSGYVSEVLIAHFGSFEKTARRFAGIRRGHVIGRAAKRFDTTISIIDPVDGSRNLAAAISEQNMVRFILACRAFEREPSEGFFDGRRARRSLQKNSAERRSLQKNILTVRFGFTPRAPDVIWGQTKKSAAKLAKHLEAGGFTVIRHASHVDVKGRRGYLFALLASTAIPDAYEQCGPEFHMQKSLDAFIQKGVRDSSMLWVDSQGRVAALKRRGATSALRYAKALLNSKTARDGLLPAGHATGPEVQMGMDGLEGAAKDAAGGLVLTDASIVRLS